MPDFAVTEEFAASANAIQLHDETRGTLIKWPASFCCLDDGSWCYRVEREDIDDDKVAAVAAAIAAHVPDPNYGVGADVLTLRDLRAKASLDATDVATAMRLILKGVRP